MKRTQQDEEQKHHACALFLCDFPRDRGNAAEQLRIRIKHLLPAAGNANAYSPGGSSKPQVAPVVHQREFRIDSTIVTLP